MSVSLSITLIGVGLFLMLLTTYVLKKGRIPEKYSLLWYAFSLIILLVAIFPNLFTFISDGLGFQVMSNLIIAIILGTLIILTMALTIMIAGQKKKTTLLIQELSLVKSRIKKLEEKGNDK